MNPTLLNNRYRIISALGTGGFGHTFLAEDTYMPSGRRCVIKQLIPQTNNAQSHQVARQRFDREAAILEELGEENNQIPRLYAYFSEAGQFYLVQEWIEGETLTSKLERQGLLSEAAVKDMLVNLLPVLDYIHSQRIVHRDLKPDNIIIRQRDGKPVLIDFGAVKEAMGTASQSIAIGTPGFMPYEQAAGQPVYASDLYSLGLTAIYLLVGKTPQKLQDLQTGEIRWRQYAPDVSSTLAAVLDRAIKLHPSDRFATAREMLAALQAGVSPSPVAVSTQATVAVAPAGLSPQPAVGQPSRRNALVISSLIAASALSAAVAIAVIIAKSPQTPPPVASSSPSTTPLPPTLTPSISPASPDPETSSPSSPSSPSPTPERSPSPTTTPQNPDLSASVPAFPVGTSRISVEAALGKPQRDLKGRWGNTRAVVYQFQPDRIDLGYLFDIDSGAIRQTEVSFAGSVDPQLMFETLDKLLAGRTTLDIRRGFRRVRRGTSNSFTFRQGELKGQIVRQDCGFIYISIWEAELHDFNVAASQKC